ncbi:MAG: hypothetical protein MUO96_03860, partial [Actinobacteria bacterium]|nr:hypothetical protein [Actinomycetota bacterium]
MKDKKNDEISNLSNNNSEELLTGKSEYLLESEEPLAESLKMRLEKVKALKKSGKKIYKNRFDKNSDIVDIKTHYSK